MSAHRMTSPMTAPMTPRMIDRARPGEIPSLADARLALLAEHDLATQGNRGLADWLKERLAAPGHALRVDRYGRLAIDSSSHSVDADVHVTPNAGHGHMHEPAHHPAYFADAVDPAWRHRFKENLQQFAEAGRAYRALALGHGHAASPLHAMVRLVGTATGLRRLCIVEEKIGVEVKGPSLCAGAGAGAGCSCSCGSGSGSGSGTGAGANDRRDRAGRLAGAFTWLHVSPRTLARVQRHPSCAVHPSEWNEGRLLWLRDISFRQDALAAMVTALCEKASEAHDGVCITTHANPHEAFCTRVLSHPGEHDLRAWLTEQLRPHDAST